MRKLVLLVLLATSLNSFAVNKGPVKLTGSVVKHDEKIVVLHTAKNKYYVPREFLGKKQFTTGSKVELLLSLEEAKQLKREPLKK
jgi:hypothetical protein